MSAPTVVGGAGGIGGSAAGTGAGAAAGSGSGAGAGGVTAGAGAGSGPEPDAGVPDAAVDVPGARDPNGPCRDLELFCFDPFDMFIFNPECFTCNQGMGCQACEFFQAI